jgi:hypothetical protein
MKKDEKEEEGGMEARSIPMMVGINALESG